MAMFKLEIECDSDDVTTASGVAAVLIDTAQKLANEGFYPNSAQWVRDFNGNRIGTYKYESRD